MKFVINLDKDITLEYDVVDEEITKQWAKVINTLTIDDACKENHYVFFDPKIINSKIQELYEINSIVNQKLPSNEQVREELNKDNWKILLNSMHINFVKLIKDDIHIDFWPRLTLYNDIIHYLESRLDNWWDEELRNEQAKFFRITLDFNKSQNKTFETLPESAYKLFSPFPEFGNLNIHYTHIGKNPFAIFLDKDYIIPKNQLVIQHTFTASVRMIFSDNFMQGEKSKIKFLNEWKNFYTDRGGKEFWGYEFDDPKLGFGFIKIGQLSNIKIKNKNIDIPNSLEKRHEFRKMLAGTKVLEWIAE